MSVAGNTTVVDGSELGNDDYVPGPSSGKKVGFAETNGHNHIEKAPSSFATTDKDYFQEDHPFVVKIGKGGVLSALEKLNEQLIASVRHLTQK